MSKYVLSYYVILYVGVEGALAAGQCTGVRAAIGYICLCNQVNSVCIATANTTVALSSGTVCFQSLDTNVPTCLLGFGLNWVSVWP